MSILTILALGCCLGAITVQANDVRARSRQGKPGQWVERGMTEEYFTGLNQSPQAVQVTTVTVTDQGDDDDVIITINGVDVTINTGTGLALAAIGAALAEAINAEPLVRGQVRATFDTATLTLTGLTPGLAFTVSIASDPDSVLSSVTTTTAAGSAAVIPFGRCVIRTGTNTGESEPLVALAASALLTAQVITTPIAFVDAAVITIRVYEIRGAEKILLAEVSEASATSQDVTVDALVALLNAALPAASVLAAADNASATAIVYTAEVAGLEFDVETFAGHEGATLPAVSKAYTTGPSASTSIHRALAGISLYSHVDPAPVGSDVGEYAGNAGVLVASKGKVWVESDEAVSAGGTCYIELGVTADNGQLFAADSATRLALARDRVRWERDGVATADSIAAVRIAL